MDTTADYSLTEIFEQINALKALAPAGKSPSVHVYVADQAVTSAFRVNFEPYGYVLSHQKDDRTKIQCVGAGQTFREAFSACRADYDAKIGDALRETTKRMAIAIITTTSDIGGCSASALRGHGFAQSEIDDLGVAAVELANTYADAGPFSILSAGSNCEPVEDAEAA